MGVKQPGQKASQALPLLIYRLRGVIKIISKRSHGERSTKKIIGLSG
jgi:hypothetical protein